MPKISFVLSLLGAKGIFLLVCFGASAVGVKATSSDAFCFLCHEMQSYRQELLQSSHAKDSRGQLIGCSRCHIPNGGIFPMLQAKVSLGFRDTWAHYANGGKIGNRQALQVAARDYIADSNCRTCHQDLLLSIHTTPPATKGIRSVNTWHAP